MSSLFSALRAETPKGLNSSRPSTSADRPAGRRAVFIDQDGTLIENNPGNTDPARLRFLPGAPEALASLTAMGFALVVVTNQSGLALGTLSRHGFGQLQAAMRRRLREEAGVTLLDVVVCPHAPAPDGQPACLCRKPAPGMLRRAARMHGLDLSASWMVGDILDDVEAGRRAGCRTVLLDTGGETLWQMRPMRMPHCRCQHWDDVPACIGQADPASPAPVS